MADSRTVTITISAKDGASQILDKVGKAAAQADVKVKGLRDSFVETGKSTRGLMEQIGLVQTVIGSALVVAIGKGVKAYAELEKAQGATAATAGTATKALVDLQQAQDSLSIAAGKTVTETGWLSEMVQRLQGVAGVAGLLTGDVQGLGEAVETWLKINPGTALFVQALEKLAGVDVSAGIETLTGKTEALAAAANKLAEAQSKRDLAGDQKYFQAQMDAQTARENAAKQKEGHELAAGFRDAMAKLGQMNAAQEQQGRQAYERRLAAREEYARAVADLEGRMRSDAGEREAETDRQTKERKEDAQRELLDAQRAYASESARIAREQGEALHEAIQESVRQQKAEMAAYATATTTALDAVVQGVKDFGVAEDAAAKIVAVATAIKAGIKAAYEQAEAIRCFASPITIAEGVVHEAAAIAYAAAAAGAVAQGFGGGGGGGGGSKGRASAGGGGGGYSGSSASSGSSAPASATQAPMTVIIQGNWITDQQYGRSIQDATRRQARANGGR